jgi:hypothetical protein
MVVIYTCGLVTVITPLQVTYTCARWLGNGDLPAAGHLSNRKAQVLKVWNPMPVCVIATSNLTSRKIIIRLVW